MRVTIEITGDKYTSVKMPIGKSYTMSRQVVREEMERVLRSAIPTYEMVVLFPIQWEESRDPLSLMTIITGRITWGKIVDEDE